MIVLRRLLAILVLGAGIVAVAAGTLASPAPAQGGTDPDTMTIQQNLVVEQPTRSCTQNVVEFLDDSKPKRAPMFWVGCVGLMSGGDGGKMAGGRVCVTYYLQPINCMSVYGTLQMTPTGPNGPTGPMQTWRPLDVRFVHTLERHGITWRLLLQLMRKLGIHVGQ